MKRVQLIRNAEEDGEVNKIVQAFKIFPNVSFWYGRDNSMLYTIELEWAFWVLVIRTNT